MSEQKRVHVVAAAIVVAGRCLIGRRPPGGSAGELWEFPGGKVEPGESPEQALRREIQEELGVDVDVGPLLGTSTVETRERMLILELYLASLAGGDPEAREHLELAWASAPSLGGFAFAAADQPLLPLVASHLTLATAPPRGAPAGTPPKTA